MKTNIQKWGHSLALRIPKALAEQANLKEGSTIDLTLEGETLLIKAIREKPSLHKLLAAIQPENLHMEFPKVEPVIKETN
jgi:antitoxin MazE